MAQMTHAAKDVLINELNETIAALQVQLDAVVASKDATIKDLEIKLRQQIRKTNQAKTGNVGQGQSKHSVLRFSTPKSCHKPECNFTFSSPEEGAAHAVAGVHNNEFALV